MTLQSFSMTFTTYVIFHNIPGPENGLTKFNDFPRQGDTLVNEMVKTDGDVDKVCAADVPGLQLFVHHQRAADRQLLTRSSTGITTWKYSTNQLRRRQLCRIQHITDTQLTSKPATHNLHICTLLDAIIINNTYRYNIFISFCSIFPTFTIVKIYTEKSTIHFYTVSTNNTKPDNYLQNFI